MLWNRHDNQWNAFWLSHDDEEYPALSILVKDNLATLSYFPKEFDAGFQSVATAPGLLAGESTTFFQSQNHADDVTILNEAVV